MANQKATEFRRVQLGGHAYECPECYAVVASGSQDGHRSWHEARTKLLADLRARVAAILGIDTSQDALADQGGAS